MDDSDEDEDDDDEESDEEDEESAEEGLYIVSILIIPIGIPVIHVLIF